MLHLPDWAQKHKYGSQWSKLGWCNAWGAESIYKKIFLSRLGIEQITLVFSAESDSEYFGHRADEQSMAIQSYLYFRVRGSDSSCFRLLYFVEGEFDIWDIYFSIFSRALGVIFGEKMRMIFRKEDCDFSRLRVLVMLWDRDLELGVYCRSLC